MKFTTLFFNSEVEKSIAFPPRETEDLAVNKNKTERAQPMSDLNAEIQKLERQNFENYQKLLKLRRDNPGVEVKNYTFQTLNGETTLLELFGKKETLFMIHNMGQGCRYCTTWADGINAFLPHLEDRFSVALVSKDDPELQRRIANDRGWRFQMASHGGGAYIQEQTVTHGEGNQPGLVCYLRDGNKIIRKNATEFGPGDEFCSIWNILSLGGFDSENWTPQFHYWRRPERMEDGGQNLN